MPLVYPNKQHMHVAMQEQKRVKLLEEIDALCTRAKEMAQEEKHLGKVMALHSRCKRLVQPRLTVNNEAERARKRESYHRKRRQGLESKSAELV